MFRSISLALGREPTFSPRLGRDPATMTDFDDDEAPWTAYFVNSMNCPPALINYVYQPKRRVATFRFLARICLVSLSEHPASFTANTLYWFSLLISERFRSSTI